MLCTIELPIYQHPVTCSCRSKDILPEVKADMKSNLNVRPEPKTAKPNSDEHLCKDDANLQKDGSTPDPEKDDMMVRRISVTQKPSGVTLTHFLPVPFSLQKTEEKPQIVQLKEKPMRSGKCEDYIKANVNVG